MQGGEGGQGITLARLFDGSTGGPGPASQQKRKERNECSTERVCHSDDFCTAMPCSWAPHACGGLGKGPVRWCELVRPTRTHGPGFTLLASLTNGKGALYWRNKYRLLTAARATMGLVGCQAACIIFRFQLMRSTCTSYRVAGVCGPEGGGGNGVSEDVDASRRSSPLTLKPLAAPLGPPIPRFTSQDADRGQLVRRALNGVARGLQRDVHGLGAVKDVKVVVVRARHHLPEGEREEEVGTGTHTEPRKEGKKE